MSITQTVSGQDMVFNFTNLLAASTSTVSVTVRLEGDYDLDTEYANIYIDGAYWGQHQGPTSQCGSSGNNRIYTPSSTYIEDGELTVLVNLSDNVNLPCSVNRVTVTLTYTSKPDLVVDYSQVPYSGNTNGNGSVFTARYRIANLGDTTVTGNFYINFHYCPTASPSVCIYLGSQYITNDFVGHSAQYFTSPNLSLPNSVEYGTRYIRIAADAYNSIAEANENNNDRYDSILVLERPDLIISSLLTTPSTISGSGSTFSAQYDVHNSGLSAVSTNFYVYYYYCPTASTSGCTYLNRTYITNTISSGETTTFTSQTLIAPNSIDYGFHYIRAVVDASNNVVESNETNNDRYKSITITTRPDLLITASTVPYTGSTSGYGSTFTGRYTLLNSANTSRNTTNFYVAYYYCDTASSTQCIYLNRSYISADLNSGQSYSFTSPSLSIPTSASNGIHYIRAFVDYQRQVAESNENNNNDYDAIVISTAKPNLDINDVSIDTGVPSGANAEFSVHYQVSNLTAQGFTTDFRVTFYYCPQQSDIDCLALGSSSYQNISTDFAGNDSNYYTSNTLTLPASVGTGTRYLRFHVDSEGDIDEYNENNNNTYLAINIQTVPQVSVDVTEATPDICALEGSAKIIDFNTALANSSGNETTNISLSGIDPTWSFSATDGSYDFSSHTWSYTLPVGSTNYSGSVTMTSPTDNDTDISGLVLTASVDDPDHPSVPISDQQTFDIINDAQASAVTQTVDDNSVEVNMPLPLNISASTADSDGSEAITGYDIEGLPATFIFNSGTDMGSGLWHFTPAEVNAGISILPPTGYTGQLTLTATSYSSDTPTDQECTLDNNDNQISGVFHVAWVLPDCNHAGATFTLMDTTYPDGVSLVCQADHLIIDGQITTGTNSDVTWEVNTASVLINSEINGPGSFGINVNTSNKTTGSPAKGL